jgi:ubiquinone biosynthesis protein Coq4
MMSNVTFGAVYSANLKKNLNPDTVKPISLYDSGDLFYLSNTGDNAQSTFNQSPPNVTGLQNNGLSNIELGKKIFQDWFNQKNLDVITDENQILEDDKALIEAPVLEEVFA